MAANSLNRKSVSKAKGLSEIVTGIINEFNKANVSIDLMKAHWKNIYDNHSV